MASLSQKLRQISSNLGEQAQQKQGAAAASGAFQTQQAITQAQAQPGGVQDAAQMAQQFAPAVTQATGQQQLQAQQQAGQQQLQAAQTAAGQQAQQTSLQLKEKQLADQKEISFQSESMAATTSANGRFQPEG